MEKIINDDFISPEESLRQKYEADKQDRNNFSYWYPKVKDCGINQSESVIIPVPFDIYKIIEGDMLCDTDSADICRNLVNELIMPCFNEFAKAGPQICFCKNGTFSNKYDAHLCFTNDYRLFESFTSICYGAACLGAKGNTEFVLRRIIHSDDSITPKIYNGLPLRPEIRVFYDFDKHKVLYSVNYWDYDYVYPNLHSITDKIIFDKWMIKLEGTFNTVKHEVESIVYDAMKNIIDLTGKWSIDIMLDENNIFWLIDMAQAEHSAYWDRRLENG